MNDETQQAALTRFDFTSGLQRGSHLLLYPRSLVHRSDAYLETVPLARVTALVSGHPEKAKDLAGNSGKTTVTVTVPHNQ